MSHPRSSSEIDRAWDDSEIEWPPLPPAPLARVPTLAKGSYLVLDAIVDAPEPPPVPAPRRHHGRRIVTALACGVAAVVAIVIAWPRPSTEHVRVSSPSAPVTAPAPKVAPATPATTVAAAAPKTKVATTAPKTKVVTTAPKTKVAAKPIRPAVTATKHPAQPSKRPVRTAAVAKSPKKAPAKRSGPHVVK